MAEYKAKDGMEDRYGEITGAITINMIMTFPVLTVYAMFIAPAIFDDSLPPILTTGVIAAIGLPIIFMRPSRAIWAWISEKFDTWQI